jgi:mycobactin phenyloxazoline synthetase
MTLTDDSVSRESLQSLIAARLDIPSAEITGDINLIALGMNSLEIMTIVNRLRRQGIAVTYEQLATQPTLDAWWQAITTVIKAQPNHVIPN